MNRVVAFEGLNGAGKSYAIASFMRRYDCQRLYELAEHFRGGKDFPQFTTDHMQIQGSIDWFIGQEVIRCRSAVEMLKEKDVIADRWLMSVCAFSYARRHKYGTDERSYLHSRIRALSDDEMRYPWIVYVKPKGDIIARIRDRESEPGFDKRSSLEEPYDSCFYRFMADYYDMLSSRLGSRCLVIDPDDDVEDNCRAVHRWLERKDDAWTKTDPEEIIL